MTLDGRYDVNNVFAKILRREARVASVYEDGDVLAFMDLFPQSTGHILVISRLSTARNILEADVHVLAKLIAVVQKMTRAVRAALRPDGVIVTQFNGEAAGQTVYHLHFHVIPCWEGIALKGHGRAEMADFEQLRALAGQIAEHVDI